MPIGTVLLAAAAAGGTYVVAKSKKKSNGEAAIAGAVVGAGTALALPLVMAALGWAVVIGIVGIPAAGVYLYMKGKEQKALPPGR